MSFAELLNKILRVIRIAPKRVTRMIVLVAVAFSLVGCFGPIPVPVRDQSDSVRQPDPVRVVRHGETLYSIAYSTGKDPAELARINKLKAPYRIRAGQTIKLEQRSDPAATGKAKSQSRPLAAPGKRTVAPKTKTAKAAPTRKKLSSGKTPSSWLWPARGKIVSTFAPNRGRKGIDIGGKEGSPVISTASGRVVYAGAGLRGFGRLVIVKHGERYLSAYAHNRKLLVAEGEWVEAGQPIGEMGKTGRKHPQLHFEIRRDGKPIDPVRYLPKR